MAKIIKMTPELREECRIAFHAELEKALAQTKFADGKLSFTKSFGTVSRKAKIYISEIAWMKMTTLLREFSKEVAWHATAYRIPGDKDEYFIKDVLVYPQTVTAATVDMDEAEYAKWLMEGVMAEDERFDHIFCQMHSHVNMSVFASGTDEQHQQEILSQLRDNDFYIFMIWNKRLEAYMRIFDMEKNILFEKEDIEWCVMDDTIGLAKFLEEAKKIVKEKTYTPTYAGNYGGNYGANQGYGRSPNYTTQNYSGPYNPASQTGAGNTQGAGTGGNKGDNKGGKGKGGKKDKKKTKFNVSTKPAASKGSTTPAITPGSNACDEQMEMFDAWGNPIDMTDPFCVHEGPHFHAT